MIDIAVSITTIASVLGGVALVLSKFKEVRHILDAGDSMHVYIGAVYGTTLPSCLNKFPDVTSIKQARLCKSKYVIIWCKTLSYALRKCDLVCGSGTDVKIHDVDDNIWTAISGDQYGANA